MAIIEQTNNAQGSSSSTPSTALDPFTTVNNGGARPLKAISAAEFATMKNGSTVYVASVRDEYKWVPASTETDDTGTPSSLNRFCNPAVNGANPGRFERLFTCSPDWLLQDFFIDSATGNNENTGATALLAINNDNELYQRWCYRGAANLTTQRIVTYAQSPVTITNLSYKLFPTASLTLLGVRTVTRAGAVITAVVAQNRATQTPQSITAIGLGAIDVGRIAIITASVNPGSVGAYARFLHDNGAGNLLTSKFGTFTPASPFTEITPVVGDVFDVVTFPQLTVGFIEQKCASTSAPLAGPTRNCCVIDSLTLDGGGFGGMSSESLSSIFFTRSIANNLNFAGVALGQIQFCGGGLGTNSFNGGLFARFRKPGILNGGFNANSGTNIQVDLDTYFENSFLIVARAAAVNTQGIAFFNGLVAEQRSLTVFGGGACAQTGAVADWGTANLGHGLVVRSTGNYNYVTKPNINGGLGAGREALIGGTDKLYAALPYVEGANNAVVVLFA